VIELISINPLETVFLVLDYFPTIHNDLMTLLESRQESLLLYLGTLLDHVLKNFDKSLAVNELLTLCRKNSFFERYICIMLEFTPQKVQPYLIQLSEIVHDEDLPTNFFYEPSIVLQSSKAQNAHRTTVWLLERSGDMFGAMNVISEELSTLVDHDSISEESSVQSCIDEGISLCTRNHMKLSIQDRKGLWLTFLGYLEYQYQQSLEHHSQYCDVMELSLQKLYRSMVGNISLNLILSQLLQYHPSSHLGRFRETLLSMFKSYQYDNILLSAAHRIVQSDTFLLQQNALKKRKRPFYGSSSNCFVCKHALHSADASESIVVFEPCRHSFHSTCLKEKMTLDVKESFVSIHDGKAWCTVCEVANVKGARARKHLILEGGGEGDCELALGVNVRRPFSG
jgi:hypothetical protein